MIDFKKLPTSLKVLGLIIGGFIVMYIIGELTDKYGDGIIMVLIYSIGFNIYFLFRINKQNKEIEQLSAHLKTCLQDINITLNIINFVFFNHDLRKSKQSMLARSIFTFEDAKKYKWEKMTDSEFSADDFTEHYYDEDNSVKEYRIEFFRQNIGHKIRTINDRYSFGNPELLGHDKHETFNITDNKLKIFNKHWDHLLRIDSRNS